MTLINPYKPEPAVIQAIRSETPDTTTYTMKFRDLQEFSFEPGQFNMITLFGYGEAPISISSAPSEDGTFEHTVRHVGNVTNAMAGLREGDTLGVRGAYGTGWPMSQLEGQDVLIIAGGIGLAPLRPVIQAVIGDRRKGNGRYGSMEILYGARTPADCLFKDDYEEWRSAEGVNLLLTVDAVPQGMDWEHNVGVVTALFDQMKSRPADTIVLTCGPEVMMKFVVRGLLERGFSPDRLYLSLERRMSCGVKKCGNCQIGSKFVCKDGPVFAYAELMTLSEEVL